MSLEMQVCWKNITLMHNIEVSKIEDYDYPPGLKQHLHIISIAPVMLDN